MTLTLSIPESERNADQEMRDKLKEYVFARNNRRSSRKDAESFSSGQRVRNLEAAERQEKLALMKIAEWVEQQARQTLGMPETPK